MNLTCGPLDIFVGFHHEHDRRQGPTLESDIITLWNVHYMVLPHHQLITENHFTRHAGAYNWFRLFLQKGAKAKAHSFVTVHSRQHPTFSLPVTEFKAPALVCVKFSSFT
ncbi:hypothetical protein ACSQ67_024605 [Phaseolus vulgaris]